MEVDLWHKQDERGVQDIMDDALIQWSKSKYWTKQWNPIIGCKPCSPACENCYAAAWAKRFGQSFEPHESSQERPPRKGVVFCGNMTDLFGEWMCPWRGSHDDYIVRKPEDLIACARGKVYNEATYLWLTKRVGNMVDAICRAFDVRERSETRRHYHYFGFTAENHHLFGARTHQMAGMFDNFNIWLSAEPLLGPIDFKDCYAYDGGDYRRDVIPFKWVVVGCESGPKRRPCKIEWVESIVEQCLTAGVPVFVKQIDIGGKCVTDITKFPKHLQIRQVPWAKEERI